MTAHHRRARRRLDALAVAGDGPGPLHPQVVAAAVDRLAADDAVLLPDVGADGIVHFGTDLDNPDFAAVARAVGVHGVRVERPGELDDALREAFAHPGPALVDVLTHRQELALPPAITFHQARGLTLWATRSVLSGDGSAVVEVTRTNLRQLAAE